MCLTRSLTALILLAALGSASAQYDVTRSGGPACWRVLTPSGAVLSRHIQETEAFSAALTAGVASGREHIYVNACPHRVSGPDVDPLPVSQPGQVLLTGKVTLQRGQQTGQVFESVVLEWSANGSDWFPAIVLTFETASLIDAIPLEAVQVRLVVPEGAN